MAISEIDPIISQAESYIPFVETSVFNDVPSAHFWIGKVAVPGEILLPEEYTAARQLRANIYIDKEGFLEPEAREVDGGESDEDDERSVQFAVIENLGDRQRVVGTSRLIVKQHEDDLLPAEHHFPEAFENQPAPVGSTEASRFIAQHPNKMTKHLISLSEIRAMDLEALERGYEPIYAVIEERLAGMFEFIGVPFRRMTELKYLPEYSTPNMAVEIDPIKVRDEIKKDLSGQLLLTQFFQNAITTRGLGHYEGDLQKPISLNKV